MMSLVIFYRYLTQLRYPIVNEMCIKDFDFVIGY